MVSKVSRVIYLNRHCSTCMTENTATVIDNILQDDIISGNVLLTLHIFFDLFLLIVGKLSSKRFFIKETIFSFQTRWCINPKLELLHSQMLMIHLKTCSTKTLSLKENIEKIKLLIFHSKYNKKNYENIIIKLQGVWLDLSWDLQVKELSKKLSTANGIFSSYITVFQKLQCYQFTMHFFILISHVEVSYAP